MTTARTRTWSRILALVAAGPCCVLLAAACGGTDYIDGPFDGGPDGAGADATNDTSDRDSTVTPPRDSALVDVQSADTQGDQDALGQPDVDAEAGAETGADADASLDATVQLDAGVDADAALIDAGVDAADANVADADASSVDAGADADADAGVLDAGGDAGNVPALQSAKNFAVLAGQTATNSGVGTAILGNLGVSPGNTVTGLPPGQPVGTIHLGNDGVAVQAQLDLTTIYNDLAGRFCAPANVLTGQNLVGKTLLPGVYCFSSSAALGVGTLTLNANNDPNAFWVFQIASTLDVAASTVTVINGGTACNIFWQVGSSATVLDNALFAGNIIALSSITLNTGAQVSPGRALARNGAVTLLTNLVSKAACP